MRNKKRFIKFLILIVLCVLISIFITLLIVFRHELKSLKTLKENSIGAYSMTYDGDYGFDEFLEIGATNDKEIEDFIIKRLLKGIPIDIDVTGAGCTAFVTSNESGDIIFARNFDFTYSPFLQVYTKPNNGYASISTVNLSFAGYNEDYLPSSGIKIKNFLTLAAPYLPFDGMNEKGVCIALLAVPEATIKNNPDKITLNTTTSIRLVLDKASTVDEAVDLLKKYNIYFSGNVYCHYLIADATGKSVLVEYYDNELRVVESEMEYQIASNFIAYNNVNIGEGFTEFDRYDTVKNKLEKSNNSISLEDCKDLLNTIGVMDGDVDKLQWSVIYNLSKKDGQIWPHRDSDKSWSFCIE